MPPGEWDYLQASYKLDPYGDDWDRTSAGAIEIINAIRGLAAGFAGEGAEPPEPMPSDLLVPFRKQRDVEAEELEAGLELLEEQRGIG